MFTPSSRLTATAAADTGRTPIYAGYSPNKRPSQQPQYSAAKYASSPSSLTDSSASQFSSFSSASNQLKQPSSTSTPSRFQTSLPSMRMASLLDGDDEEDTASAASRSSAAAVSENSLRALQQQREREAREIDARRRLAQQLLQSQPRIVPATTATPTSNTFRPSQPSVASSSIPKSAPIPAVAASSTARASPTPSDGGNVSVDPQMVASVSEFLHRLFPSAAASGNTLAGLDLTSPAIVGQIYDFQSRLAEDEERARIIEDELREATRELRAETARIQTLNGSLGLSDPAQTLSESARANLAILTSVAQKLALKNVETATYTAALLDLRTSNAAATHSLSKSRSALSNAHHSLSTESALREEIKKLREQLDAKYEAREFQKEMDTKKKQVIYFSTKSKEYEQDVKEVSDKLNRAGFDETFTHEALQKLSEEIAQITQQLQPLDTQLESYQQLPPDYTLARMKVTEARQTLAQLEDQFSSQIRDMQHPDDY